jgi:hypothetical protein
MRSYKILFIFFASFSISAASIEVDCEVRTAARVGHGWAQNWDEQKMKFSNKWDAVVSAWTRSLWGKNWAKSEPKKAVKNWIGLKLDSEVTEYPTFWSYSPQKTNNRRSLGVSQKIIEILVIFWLRRFFWREFLNWLSLLLAPLIDRA